MFNRLFAVAFLLVTPVIAFGQTLADKVPGDSVLYVGWAGSDSLGPQYDGSHLKAILDASNARDLFDKTLPQAIEKLGQQNPEAAQAFKLAGSIAGPMFHHPSAFYFEGVDFSNHRQPQPRLGLICDAGADADALKAQLDQLVQQAGQTPVPVLVSRDNNVITVAIGAPQQAQSQKPLAEQPNFTSALAQVNKEPLLTVYVDGDNLLTQLNDAVLQSEDRDAQENWPKLRDGLGLAGFHRAIATAAFDGADWSTQVFVAVPAPRSGLIPSLFDVKPLSDDLLKVVPVSADTVSAGHFDLAKLWDSIHDGVIKFNPNAEASVNGVIDQVNQMAGINIRDDLLGSLGDEWVGYSASTVGGNGLLGMVVVNPLKNAEKAEQALSTLEKTATNLIAQQMHGAPFQITFKEVTVGENKIHYLAVPVVSPAWEVRGGKLFIALYPQVVADAADFAASHDKSILDSEAFQSARAKLKMDNVKPTALQFMDLPKTATDSYQTLLAVSRLYTGGAEMFGLDSPPMLIPPISKLQHELNPAMSIGWVDDDGFHARGISPFPGSALLGSQPAVIVAQDSVLMSILLPSLNKARATANSVKSASNLRQIGMGCFLYANDHKQQYPPDLGTICNEEQLSPMVFISPFHNSAVTLPGRDNADALAAWVNANSDYVYIAAGKTTALGADQIIAYEKPGVRPDRNSEVLFGDGHVEHMLGDMLQQQLAKQNNPQP